MMGAFESAIAYVLENEGGFVDSPSDPGGATNFGLSLRFLKQISLDKRRKYGLFNDPLTIDDIKELTKDQAINIYKGEFWDQAPYDKISENSDVYICRYVFDMSVNHGLNQGIKIFQRSMNAVKGEVDFVNPDGILGDGTLKAIMEVSPIQLEIAMRAERAEFMYGIAEKNAKEGEIDLHGWLTRCYRS